MYGGYSVAGLTRQFVALKTVSSNLTTHPTEYVLHSAERIFLYIDIVGANLGSPAFFHQFSLIRCHAPKRTAYLTEKKKDDNLKAAAQIQRLYIL